MNDKILTALIAVITSIITLVISFLLKPRIERKSLITKVKIEHEYEQRKKIKETLSKYKVHIINSADSLKGRLNNLSVNHGKKWHFMNNNYDEKEQYYFQSTVYRILRLFAWIKILDSKLIYLDTTIATENDLDFIKYLKAIRRTLQRGNLVEGLQNDKERQRDSIFRDTLDEMCLWIINEDLVLSFTEFKDKILDSLSKYLRLCEFLDGITPEEDRRRWDRLYCLQLLLISFINSYGYDFQFESDIRIENQIIRIKKYDIFKNLVKHIKKYKLEDETNAKKMINKLYQYGSQQSADRQ